MTSDIFSFPRVAKATGGETTFRSHRPTIVHGFGTKEACKTEAASLRMTIEKRVRAHNETSSIVVNPMLHAWSQSRQKME